MVAMQLVTARKFQFSRGLSRSSEAMNRSGRLRPVSHRLPWTRRPRRRLPNVEPNFRVWLLVASLPVGAVLYGVGALLRDDNSLASVSALVLGVTATVLFAIYVARPVRPDRERSRSPHHRQ